MVVIVVLLAVPMFLLCGPAMSILRNRTPTDGRPEPVLARQMRQVLGWMLLIELAVFAVAVVAGRFYQVHERYLVVLLPPLPLWLMLQARAAERARPAAAILVAGLVLALVMTVVRPVSVRPAQAS